MALLLVGSAAAVPSDSATFIVNKQIGDIDALTRRLEEQHEEEAAICEKHDWRPALRPNQPRPPASMCPGCLIDATATQDMEREQREVEHPQSAHDVGSFRAHRLDGRHVREPRPGSIEEQDAIRRIDDLREEERDRERRRKLGVRRRGHLVGIRGNGGLRDYLVLNARLR